MRRREVLRLSLHSGSLKPRTVRPTYGLSASLDTPGRDDRRALGSAREEPTRLETTSVSSLAFIVRRVVAVLAGQRDRGYLPALRLPSREMYCRDGENPANRDPWPGTGCVAMGWRGDRGLHSVVLSLGVGPPSGALNSRGPPVSRCSATSRSAVAAFNKRRASCSPAARQKRNNRSCPNLEEDEQPTQRLATISFCRGVACLMYDFGDLRLLSSTGHRLK